MKNKILLIDDEAIFRDELKNDFENSEYVLLLASNSVNGLDIIKREDIDLVLLDIIMPDLNNVKTIDAGIKLLPEIKKIKPFLPVIMISVQNEAKPAVDALKLGAIDYITKDLISNKEELFQRIKNVITNNIKFLIQNGEDESLEFKSSMRWNFKLQKIDESIKFYYLKTIVSFLNTKGGILLIGVKDDGNILGITHDKFENKDKYLLHFNNQIKDIIGVKYLNYIKPRFIEIETNSILYVECLKCIEPVFLNINHEEQFYIRMGNSSRPLSMSEMVEYLKTR